MAETFSSFKELLESEKYADLTLKCQEEVFRVHCAIVCTRSRFLMKAVDGQFKEAALREIDLSADEIPIIRALICYLYANDYPDAAEEQHLSETTSVSCCGSCEEKALNAHHSQPAHKDEAFPLMFNVKMYIAGDRYEIPRLKELATKKYQACVAQHWNNSTFSEAALHLWDNTVESDRQLRVAVIEASHKHLGKLLDRGEFVDLMKSHGDFCLDIVKMTQGRSLDVACDTPVEATPKESFIEPQNDAFGWGSFSTSKKDKLKKAKGFRND
ncbi:hypothetical protein EG329_012400 [Mollisiaceae sp. DMI_Dod_QoI]|nr:hypothetical protein EG329_012400 [Helotiales sp. DMI_Dod_QoI]